MGHPLRGRPTPTAGRLAWDRVGRDAWDRTDYLTWVFDHMGTHRDQLGREPEELTPMAYREFLAEQGARAA